MPEKAVITAAAVLQGPSSCHYAATNHSHISAWVFSTNKNVNIQDCVWILRFLENSAWRMISAIQPEFTSKARGCKLYLEQVLLWSPLIEYHAYPYPCALPCAESNIPYFGSATHLPAPKVEVLESRFFECQVSICRIIQKFGNCKAERIPRKCKEHEMSPACMNMIDIDAILIDIDWNWLILMNHITL